MDVIFVCVFNFNHTTHGFLFHNVGVVLETISIMYDYVHIKVKSTLFSFRYQPVLEYYYINFLFCSLDFFSNSWHGGSVQISSVNKAAWKMTGTRKLLWPN